MSLKEEIHQLFGVKEAHELPATVMRIVMNPNELSKAINNYREKYPDLKLDILRDYFQECAADRKSFMQDYTPDGICQIVAGLTGKQTRIADLCAGTGSLTIAAWAQNPDARFICYELSTAAIPLLLFNLAVREIRATVYQGDLLTGAFSAVYHVKGGRVTGQNLLKSQGHTCADASTLCDAVITNPPYSLKWEGKTDARMAGFAAAPKSKADLAFVLIGLSMLKPGGQLVGILPHGVLFRGAGEAEIRKQLVDRNLLDGVIGLAPALFANTSIPVCLLVLKNNRPADAPVMIVNAEKLFKKRPKQNTLSREHVQKIIQTYQKRAEEPMLASLISPDQIYANECNMNLPRYVCTEPPEPPVDCIAVMDSLLQIQQEEKALDVRLSESVQNITGTNKKSADEWNRFMERFLWWAA